MKTEKKLDEPGPGSYKVGKLRLPAGGRFNLSKPKSSIDWQIYRASTIPGPADYPAPQLPGVSGGQFSTAKPKTELEWIEYRAAQQPGPADYGAPRLPKPGGGRFSTANPKTELEWIEYFGKQLPGAADYFPAVDKLSRYKSSPSFSVKGKVRIGNHQTTLSDAIIYQHHTINEHGPNQCRTDGAFTKQVSSLKRNAPGVKFSAAGSGLVAGRGHTHFASEDKDDYAKYFGYTPGSRRHRHHHRSRARSAERDQYDQDAEYVDEDYVDEYGAAPSSRSASPTLATALPTVGADSDMGGAAAGAASPGVSSPDAPAADGGASSPAPLSRKKSSKQSMKRTASQQQQFTQLGRPLFLNPDTPGPQAYEVPSSTFGPQQNSRLHSAPSFTISNVV